MTYKTSMESLEALTAAVEAAGVDIAPDYSEFLRLAFAIATDCGEAGRDCFHRLCRLYHDYKRDATDRMFNGALKSGRGDIHLGTAFHLAQTKGVECKQLLNEWEQNSCGKREARGTETMTTCAERTEDGAASTDPRMPLPFLPTFDWPSPLRETLAAADRKEQRDALLLGAFTVIGATLGDHVRALYGKKWIYPSMQTFIVAPPASGKGILAFLRAFGTPRHRELRDEYERKMREYMAAVRARRGADDGTTVYEMPEKPKNKMFFIAGNNTGTGILQNLIDSDGEGLIFEPEADTVSSAIKGDYGHWSDTLRKAFDHDTLSFNRRTDNEYRETTSTKLAVLLSGTPAQVGKLIPSAENGLFSRQIFYYMPSSDEWIDQFARKDENTQELFEKLGEQWGLTAKNIRQSLFSLSLSTEQRNDFNNLFARMLTYTTAATGNEMSGTVMRLAVNILRMMSVTAALEALEGKNNAFPDNGTLFPITAGKNVIPPGNYILTIPPHDFDAVLALAEPLKAHAAHVLSLLPQTVVKRRTLSDKAALLESMGSTFTRQQFIEEARKKGIEGSMPDYLYRLAKRGILEKTQKWGEYKKKITPHSPSSSTHARETLTNDDDSRSRQHDDDTDTPRPRDASDRSMTAPHAAHDADTHGHNGPPTNGDVTAYPQDGDASDPFPDGRDCPDFCPF